MNDEPKFLNPYAHIARHTNRLPHWQQDGATFFVTFHLADSLPKALLDQWQSEREAWLRWNPKPWSPKQGAEYHKRFSAQKEKWLDEAHGSCVLRAPEVAAIVASVLETFESARYTHHSWIVMPNHVHALFSLISGNLLEDAIQGWKGVSSRRINQRSGRRGTLWQKDYFDRLIRDADHFWNCVRYIRHNPAKANLSPGEYLLYEHPSVGALDS